MISTALRSGIVCGDGAFIGDGGGNGDGLHSISSTVEDKSLLGSRLAADGGNHSDSDSMTNIDTDVSSSSGITVRCSSKCSRPSASSSKSTDEEDKRSIASVILVVVQTSDGEF